MIVDLSSHWNTHEKRYELTLTGSSVAERSCVTNNTHALAIHNPVYTGEDTHHEPRSSVVYPIYDEVGQAHLYQTSQPEGSQIPFPYLVPQPSVGRAQANINGRYEMQEPNLYSKPSVVQSSDCQQGLQCAVSDQIVVVPTDPVTGYSTMLRTDKIRANPSQDLAYESSRMNDRPSMINHGMSLQSNISYCKLASYCQSSSSTSASNILSPTSIDSNIPHSMCPQFGFPSPSLTDTPMVPADLGSEAGYTILRDGRPQVPTGQGPNIPVYNTIDLKGVCPPVSVNNDTVILQANDSYGNAHSSDSQPDPSSKFLKSGASVSLSYISP